jgi:O-antigen ligase
MGVAESNVWRERSSAFATMTPTSWRFWVFVPCPLIALCVLLANFPLPSTLILSATVVALLIFFRPFVGVPIIFLLGMLGDLQHFTGGISIVKYIVLCAAIGLVASHSLRSLLRRRTGVTLPLVLFIAIYCGGNALRLSETYDWSVVLTWLGYPLGFVLVLSLVTTKRRIEWVLAALIAGAVLAGLSSAIEVFFGVNMLTSIRGIEEVVASNGPPGMQRISGFFNDANAAAYMHILSIPILISLLIMCKNWLWRSSLLALSLICGFSLLASFSRSGYLGLVASLLCLLFFLKLGKASRVLLLSAAVVLLLTYFIPARTIAARFYTIPEEMGGIGDRSLYYPTAMRLIYEHPILPAGEEAFMSAIGQKVGFPLGPHSNLLSVGVNSGLIGLAALLWLMYRYVHYVHAGLKTIESQSLRYYALGAYAGAVGFQVQGLFITNFGWFPMWATAAIPLCCILADRGYSKVNDSRRGQRAVRART